jgi:hypothetical protein
MASGRVTFISRNQGMIVVSHDDGHTVVELLGSEGEFSLGQTVAGDWDGLGGEPLYSFDPHTEHDAYFQGTWPSFEAAVRIARNTGGG